MNLPRSGPVAREYWLAATGITPQGLAELKRDRTLTLHLDKSHGYPAYRITFGESNNVAAVAKINAIRAFCDAHRPLGWDRAFAEAKFVKLQRQARREYRDATIANRRS